MLVLPDQKKKFMLVLHMELVSSCAYCLRGLFMVVNYDFSKFGMCCGKNIQFLNSHSKLDS